AAPTATCAAAAARAAGGRRRCRGGRGASLHCNASLLPVSPNLRHVHRCAEEWEGVERAGHFGAQGVVDLPDALREVVDEQRDFAVAQLLIAPRRAVVRRGEERLAALQ